MISAGWETGIDLGVRMTGAGKPRRTTTAARDGESDGGFCSES
jgi:hypothetical protein